MDVSEVIYKNAWPYQQDKMNLPVNSVEEALPFYENIMGFMKTAEYDTPHKAVVLSRNGLEIGLAENGGDPTQDGCFFEVSNAEAAFDELQAKGWDKGNADFSFQRHGTTNWKVFFVVAPDGLCYCIGQKQGV